MQLVSARQNYQGRQPNRPPVALAGDVLDLTRSGAHSGSEEAVPPPRSTRRRGSCAIAKQGGSVIAAANRLWAFLRWPLVLGSLGYAAYSQWPDVAAAGHLVHHLAWPWVALAVFAQYGSLGFTGRVQRRLLAAGGVRVSRSSAVGLVYAGSAASLSFLGSGWLARTFTYRALKDRGADEVLASWVVGVSAIASNGALLVVAIVGAEAARTRGAAVTVLASTSLLAVLVAATVLLRARARLLQVARRLLGWCQRVTGRPAGDPGALIADLQTQFKAIHTRRTDWILIASSSLAIWMTDLFCLSAAFRAVGSHAPWPGVIVVYTAGLLAGSLPFLPGGFGVVEAAMAATSVAYGASKPAALAAILLYRLIRFWGVLAIGWIARWHMSRPTEAAPPAATEAIT